jgi:fructuronate reductase
VEERASVVGVVREALWAPGEGSALLARLAAPTTRIVTLTVTEKGYCHNPATGDLDLAHPDIRADLAGRDPPRSALGWLARGLQARRAAGAGGLTVLCCDNMASNGRTLRGLVRQFAGHVDPGSPPGSRTGSASRAAWSTGSSRQPPRPRFITRRSSWACATRRR